MARGRRSKPNFTPLQREAIYALVIGDNLSAPKAREVLVTFGLGPVAPFQISTDSVRRIAREMSTIRRAVDAPDLTAEPDAAIGDLFRAGIRIAQGELERMRAEQERSKPIDPRDFRAWVLALRELRKDAADAARTPHNGSAQASPTESTPDPGSLLERLERADSDTPEDPAPTPLADRTLATRSTETEKTEDHDNGDRAEQQRSSEAGHEAGQGSGIGEVGPIDAMDAELMGQT